MTEAVKEAEDTRNPMEKAVAHGFKEPEPMAREDRVKAVIDGIDHAMKHNSPVARETREELVALLGAK